jgi:hypothetical protein
MTPLTVIIGVAALVLFGAVGHHLWEDNKRDKKLDALVGINQTLTTNYDTCQAVNEGNLVVINRQRESIARFIEEQDTIMIRNQTLAEELAARQLAVAELSRRNRETVRQALSTEACAGVEHPAHVHRVLNDAIAKASSGAN